MSNDETNKYEITDKDESEEIVSKEREDRGLNHALERMDYYFRLAKTFRLIHHILQIIVIIGATILPFLLNIPDLPKAIPIILSGIVAVAVALINFYKFGDRSRTLFLSSEALRKEYNLYIHFREPYNSYLRHGVKAYELFSERIEAITFEEDLRSFTIEELLAEGQRRNKRQVKSKRSDYLN